MRPHFRHSPAVINGGATVMMVVFIDPQMSVMTETKTEAVTQALRERLQRVRRARAKRRLADDLDEIALHCSSLPVRDPRSADEIMGYDEHGLPR